MKKIKRIFVGVGLFLASMFSKVFAIGLVETKYGVFYGGEIQTKYGIPGGFIKESFWSFKNISKIAVPVVLFFIGLFVVLNKKISKKIKIITVTSLIALYLLFLFIMNYVMSQL